MLTLIEGVEAGLIAGVELSIFIHLYKTSKPHVAVVGQLPGTMNFRNKERHNVATSPEILSLRIDASLYFPNARFIEESYEPIPETMRRRVSRFSEGSRSYAK